MTQDDIGKNARIERNGTEKKRDFGHWTWDLQTNKLNIPLSSE